MDLFSVRTARASSLSLFALSVMFSSGQPALAQTKAATYVPQANEFAAAVVMRAKTGALIYAFKPDRLSVAASLTKLANALAVVHHPVRWNRIVTLRQADEVGGGRLRVRDGARMSLRDLFYSSITGSANNAANALARLSPFGRKRFIVDMNREARRSGARRSNFVDPAGMNPKNVTTARDMAQIARRAFKNPLIRSAASVPEYHFIVRNTGQNKTIHTTDHLLSNEPRFRVVGGKTGYLQESNYNFVAQLRPLDAQGKPASGQDMIVVVLGAPTKAGSFQSATRLALFAWSR